MQNSLSVRNVRQPLIYIPQWRIRHSLKNGNNIIEYIYCTSEFHSTQEQNTGSGVLQIQQNKQTTPRTNDDCGKCGSNCVMCRFSPMSEISYCREVATVSDCKTGELLPAVSSTKRGHLFQCIAVHCPVTFRKYSKSIPEVSLASEDIST